LIDLLARTGIYGTDETNVNRKIIPSIEIIRMVRAPSWPKSLDRLRTRASMRQHHLGDECLPNRLNPLLNFVKETP
jgi:hypothetical protein